MKQEASTAQVYQKFLITISVFSQGRNLNIMFLDVVPFSGWGILVHSEHERLCNHYKDCSTPFYECLFSSLGLHFPFNKFLGGVLHYLMVSSSQLYHASWANVKVFQYWCEYKITTNGINNCYWIHQCKYLK